MPLVVVVALTVLGVAAANRLLQRSRTCPACQEPLTPVASPDGLHTYEVLACPACPTAVTLSQGVRRRFAFCPRCGQRSLRTDPERLPDTPTGPLVTVHESCALCGWTDHRFATPDAPSPRAANEEPAPRGVVLPFPGQPQPGPSQDPR